MDPAHKAQVLQVSELANHPGYKHLVNFIVSQTRIIANKGKAEGTSGDEALRCWGEMRGLEKIVNFVASMVEAKQDIKP